MGQVGHREAAGLRACSPGPCRRPPPPPAPRSEFQTPDEEMKKIVLKVVKQCVATDGVEPDYIRTEVGGGRGGRGQQRAGRLRACMCVWVGGEPDYIRTEVGVVRPYTMR